MLGEIVKFIPAEDDNLYRFSIAQIESLDGKTQATVVNPTGFDKNKKPLRHALPAIIVKAYNDICVDLLVFTSEGAVPRPHVYHKDHTTFTDDYSPSHYTLLVAPTPVVSSTSSPAVPLSNDEEEES